VSAYRVFHEDFLTTDFTDFTDKDGRGERGEGREREMGCSPSGSTESWQDRIMGKCETKENRLLSPSVSSLLITTHKSGMPLKAIPKGLCPPAQGCEPASYPGISCKPPLNPNGVVAVLATHAHNPVGVGPS